MCSLQRLSTARQREDKPPPRSRRGRLVPGKYTMRISRMTVENIGIKLYDKVAAVLAEVIANSYDADAEHVVIRAPLNTYLARKSGGELEDLGHEIEVVDDGHGMTAEDVNRFYLNVGINRRVSRGQETPGGRRVMGRKGIGKLAPFGICREVEVWTAGGEADSSGYEVAHLILRLDAILSDTDEDYNPEVGPDDGSRSPARGTKVILRRFNRRRVPSAEDLHRQLAARIGIERADWQVQVVDSLDSEPTFTVGALQIDKLDGTEIDVSGRPVAFEGGALPVSGWVAYSKDPYKDESMAGIRIFARQKLVAQTRDFGIKSGFTGEYKLRSYIVGEVHADWLDEEEDLVRSDRQDIIWNSERGEALQEWGQTLIQSLAASAETSLGIRVWDEFLERSSLEDRLMKVSPKDAQLRDSVRAAARMLISRHDREPIRKNPEYVEQIVALAFTIGPHRDLIEALRKVSSSSPTTLPEILQLFVKAGIVELHALGQVADERVKAVEELAKLIKSAETDERQLQELIERAPWLTYPEWTPLANNRSLARVRTIFEGWYEKNRGQPISTSAIENPRTKPDFVLLSNEATLQIIEIKKPDHALDDDEVTRAYQYLLDVLKFLEDNPEIAAAFPRAELTIVCDATNFHAAASEAVFQDPRVTRKTWEEVLDGTMKAHGDFLDRVRVLRGLEASE